MLGQRKPVMHGEHSPPRPAIWLRTAPVLVELVLLAALGYAIYFYFSPKRLPSEPDLVAAREPRALPELQFQDVQGKAVSLAGFRGKVVLLNVWATWCAPCRKEMPALDRVQQALGGPEFEVVALSIDGGGAAPVRRFYDEIGIRTLAIYIDASTEATTQLATIGIPTTLLVDREGRELWRKTGPAQWDSPKYLDLLRRHIGDAGSASGPR